MFSLPPVALAALMLCACAAAPPQTESQKQVESGAADLSEDKIVPLEDIIANGDYNNDAPPDTPVPGAQTGRTIPEDPFLERVKNRDPE